MPLVPGARLGPYELVALVDSGGLVAVGLARDARLGRDIAIKVRPTEFALDVGRVRRFELEARTAAALNHPNILTIHSVEQSDHVLFLTMELIEGRPLSCVMPTSGMAVEELLAIAIPLVDAVAAAQVQGTTHRDLKPANIMSGSGSHAGRLKVLDFGVAKLIDRSIENASGQRATAVADTVEGHIVGTVAYMSPEQAAGRIVDSRSDIFSLGVILVEMGTGQRPFQGDSAVWIAAASG